MLAIQFQQDFIIKGSEKLTRELTREVLKYVDGKNFKNKTVSVNHVNDIWENVHREFESFDVNLYLRETIDQLLHKPSDYDILLDPSKANNTHR